MNILNNINEHTCKAVSSIELLGLNRIPSTSHTHVHIVGVYRAELGGLVDRSYSDPIGEVRHI